MTPLIGVVVDRGMGGGNFLQGFCIPEPDHRPFWSTERLVKSFSLIVKSPTALLIGSIADYLNRRSVAIDRGRS
jgi:hypothetical protein